ncbi:TonB-dependent siderophore myxochelin receptor MxcH [Sorangium atrum]|uniref:TonB-dependent siderophore myxochelin receptor MxcH n=1 Tax=Sorangium atrum TaxID=2995308 RepID=A0ABT5C8N2_9BACT|nr:TonB-dependent siderophore myxochelin receptor MxcH [Sorangium aterium]MDC0682124.1 TonB-dependent siderophore myxochelin receptor MxcH [Sorangium aterium]
MAFAADARASDEAPADEGVEGAAPQAETAPAARAPGDGAAPAVRPPELTGAVEAAYPQAAREAGLEGSVVLRLTIDAEGRVTGAEVAEPAGHGFDEAAREAALRFRFTPARRGDRSVASRILYRHDFRLPAPPPAAVPGAGMPAGRAVPAAVPVAGAAEAAPAVGAAGPALPAIEVSVRGASEAERLRTSAQAVQVIETVEARRQAADLGEVLSRAEGVSVRRLGGLGSDARFSLNGLTDDRIRFFLDGVPLDLAGHSFGVANVPVNLVERAEIYRGVVPLRFGSDALGGAVNLVTDQDTRGAGAAASYQVGSFGTYRLTLGARHAHAPSGLFARASGFVDRARNDYPIDVMAFDESGRPSPARARRFHDGYVAAGGAAEVGVTRRPWADRLLVRAFFTSHDKELQHGPLVTMLDGRVTSPPFGEATFGRQTGGALLRYAQPFFGRARLDALAGYSYARTTFVDMATCTYDWSDRCKERPYRGEVGEDANDQQVRQHTAFARVNAAWHPATDHLLRFGLSPTHVTRTGRNLVVAEREKDPLTAERDLWSGVAGVEYEARPLDGRLANIAFAKLYLQSVRTREHLPSGRIGDVDRATHRVGAGDSLRFRFTDAIYAKASYEVATRLPTPEELFGDGGLVVSNVHLEPEASHNVNVGVTLERAETPVGQLRFNVNGFGRFTEDLITLQRFLGYSAYGNTLSARSVGFESTAGWTSPGDWLSVDGHVTWQDFRDGSTDVRIQNLPYLFGGVAARAQWPEIAARRDVLSLTWITDYVHAFFVGPEGRGAARSKAEIPSQLLHTLALTYLVERGGWTVSSTVEVQNLTDEKAFSFHGIQRPGRAAYAKLALSL